MIFDLSESKSIVNNYVDFPDWRVPKFVLLARAEKLTREREIIERTVADIPLEKRSHLLKRFINDDDNQHLGAWFEIRLFDWLKNSVGEVEYEPFVEENNPDFKLTIDETIIFIEAHTVPVNDEAKMLDGWSGDMTEQLRSIRLPYAVDVGIRILNQEVDPIRLKIIVESWLQKGPEESLLYRDDFGNVIEFGADHIEKLDSVATSVSFPVKWISSSPLKKRLKKKASQHKAIRQSGYPYIIALMTESWEFGPREVVSAWFGRDQYVIDKKTKQIVD